MGVLFEYWWSVLQKVAFFFWISGSTQCIRAAKKIWRIQGLFLHRGTFCLSIERGRDML